MAQAEIGGLHGASTPLPQPGTAEVLRTSAVLTAAWVATDVVSVKHARRVTLYCAYAADASGTGNRAQIRVMCTAEQDPTDGGTPDVGDDVWYPPVIVDSTPTVTDLTGTVESGLDYNLANHAVVVARPMAITLGDPADAGTDASRYAITLDVGPFLWLYVAAKELGDVDAGDLGVLGIKYSLST
jgi:hypothetical protein